MLCAQLIRGTNRKLEGVTVLRLLQVAFFALIVIAIVGLIGVAVMGGLARSDGVENAEIPPDSYIFGYAGQADYADAYVAPMQFSAFGNIDAVAANAFERGDHEIHRSEREVTFEGTAPGVTYQISYILDLSASPATLTVCTAVHVENRRGRAYFTVVKPIHKMLLPYLVNRMSKSNID